MPKRAKLAGGLSTSIPRHAQAVHAVLNQFQGHAVYAALWTGKPMTHGARQPAAPAVSWLPRT